MASTRHKQTWRTSERGGSAFAISFGSFFVQPDMARRLVDHLFALEFIQRGRRQGRGDPVSHEVAVPRPTASDHGSPNELKHQQ